MKRLTPNLVVARPKAVLEAKIAREYLERHLPVPLESIDPFAAPEPSVGCAVELETGQALLVTYGVQTGRVLFETAPNESTGSVLEALRREFPLDASQIIWEALPVQQSGDSPAAGKTLARSKFAGAAESAAKISKLAREYSDAFSELLKAADVRIPQKTKKYIETLCDRFWLGSSTPHSGSTETDLECFIRDESPEKRTIILRGPSVESGEDVELRFVLQLKDRDTSTPPDLRLEIGFEHQAISDDLWETLMGRYGLRPEAASAMAGEFVDLFLESAEALLTPTESTAPSSEFQARVLGSSAHNLGAKDSLLLELALRRFEEDVRSRSHG